MNPFNGMTADELAQICTDIIDEIHDEQIAYEEAIAIRTPDDGLNTDQRAIEALHRLEQFPGEHRIAMAWLASSLTARLRGRT